MNSTTHSHPMKTNINRRIIKALQNQKVPWHRRWVGCLGFPRNIFNQKKYFGINFILLQMAMSKHKFTSNWWGTSEQFLSKGFNIKPRPDNVVPGDWGTEIVLYKTDLSSSNVIAAVVYNLGQISNHEPPKVKPVYELAESVLHATNARIKNNDNKEAWYVYPPYDYITLPSKEAFEAAIGGLPGYYDTLAHELIHWTETKLNFDVNCHEAIRELRAEIGSAMLIEELGIPHSISMSNYNKWREDWIELMKLDANFIFKISASACLAVDYILSFSGVKEERAA